MAVWHEYSTQSLANDPNLTQEQRDALGAKCVTDLFYADMDDWEDDDSDGVYESQLWPDTVLKTVSSYKPELICGRLSAFNVMGDDYADEAGHIISYFYRIRNYRYNNNSSPLTEAQKDSGVLFRDDDGCGKVFDPNLMCDIENMQQAVPNVSIYLDKEVTSMSNLLDILKTGHRFLYLSHHGGSVDDWPDNQFKRVLLTLDDLEDLSGNDRPYTEYMNVNSCGEGMYYDIDTGTPRNYHAGIYLFNSRYMLNNTAGTFGSPVFGVGSFFEKLNDEEPIGVAWQAMINDTNE